VSKTPIRKVKNPNIVTSVIFSGYVKSTTNKPIPNAKVEVNKESTNTSENGFFRIMKYYTQEQEVPKRFILNINKEGYGPLSKIYRSGIQNRTWFMTKAHTEKINPRQANTVVDLRRGAVSRGSLSSQVDWSQFPHRRIPRRVDQKGRFIGEASDVLKKALEFAENANQPNDGISVMIPANSLVDSFEKPPKGEILVTLSTVDIYDPDSMPGNYTVDMGEDRRGYMETYGAGSIKITSEGKEFSLKKGEKAKIRIPINQYQLAHIEKLEPTIPFLQYDEKRGVWEIKGKAWLDSNRKAYVAEIDHFSIFNMDIVFTDPACIVLHSFLDQDYELEIIYESEPPFIKTFTVNRDESEHVICRLPPNEDIILRAYSTRTCGHLGDFRFPITDAIVVNAGNTQQFPDPYCPDPQNPPGGVPITENCHGEVTIDSASLGPILTGPATVECTEFTLIWRYTWTAGQNDVQDHFDLEEKKIWPTEEEDFHVIWQTKPGERLGDVVRTLSRIPGEYMYRVKAKSAGHDSTYSNVICVVVEEGDPACTQANPAILKIVNDLDDVDAWEADNGIIGLRVGKTAIEAEGNLDLYSNSDSNANAPGDAILPRYNQTLSSNSEEVAFPVGDYINGDGDFYLYIRVGKWIVDTTQPPLGSVWIKENTIVENCLGVDAEKLRAVLIKGPFLNPIPHIIRISEYLPHRNYSPHHPTCA